MCVAVIESIKKSASVPYFTTAVSVNSTYAIFVLPQATLSSASLLTQICVSAPSWKQKMLPSARAKLQLTIRVLALALRAYPLSTLCNLFEPLWRMRSPHMPLRVQACLVQTLMMAMMAMKAMVTMMRAMTIRGMEWL
jgi:hypothetical protein